jgi:hypothetical protein
MYLDVVLLIVCDSLSVSLLLLSFHLHLLIKILDVLHNHLLALQKFEAFLR